MDTSGFFVLHNPKAFDSQDTSSPPVFFLSYGFSSSTDGSFLLQHIVLFAVSFQFYSSCYSASAPFSTSSPGFKVFTLMRKYNRWHTQTTAIQILPIDTFFMQIKPIAITTVTIPMILQLVSLIYS